MSSPCISPQAFPPELWSHVFDSLDFDSLVVASHICQAVRFTAQAHPTFWRDIQLLKASNAQLDIFRKRLRIGQPDLLPISLRIVLDGQPQHRARGGIRHEVLKELLDVMPRVTHLDIDCLMSLDVDMRAILESPAPQLRTLRVHMLHNYSTRKFDKTMPSQLLAGHAPALHSIELDGYSEPGEEPQHVFPSVKQVTFSSDLLEYLVLIFPNVTDVCLGLAGLYPEYLEEEALAFLLSVPRITLCGDVEDYDPPSPEAIEFLEPRAEYTLRDGDISQILVALEQLNGPLSLEYIRTDGAIRDPQIFKFASVSDGKARVLIDTGTIDTSVASMFWSSDSDGAEILRCVTHYNLIIGADGNSMSLTFKELKEAALQFLPALTDLSIGLVGTSEGREYNWPEPWELEDDLHWQVESVAAGQDLAATIPHANGLARIVLRGQKMSHSDAKGLITTAGYLVDQMGDVMVEVRTEACVETSVLQLLEEHFCVVHVPK